MTCFQLIFAPLCFLLGALLILRARTQAAFRWKGIIWAFLWALGGIMILWPNVTTIAAWFLGIGRGSDLVLYVGALIGMYVFQRLYGRIRRPEWHIVMLGDAPVDLSPYRALPNMHFLGRKPYSDLPAYCKQFDVGLIPFKMNELTRAVNPIKLREYLAAGLPVVSTPLPEVARYERWIEVADTAGDFAAAIAKALAVPPHYRIRAADAMAAEVWPEKLRAATDLLTTQNQPPIMFSARAISRQQTPNDHDQA